MHELSIALSILDIAAEEAERRSARVRSIHLKLGRLSGVVKEALLSAYELAREAEGLDDVPLLIEEIAVQLHCPHCAMTRPAVSVWQLCCAECGTPSADIVSGRELEVVALEIQ